MKRVDSSKNVADIFTKLLSPNIFIAKRQALGLIDDSVQGSVGNDTVSSFGQSDI